jgi:hypothetical protein
MNTPQDLQVRMIELGRKYLERTAGELDELGKMIDEVPRGDASAYKNVEVLVHRIRGSGAMFGFNLISDAAFGIEMLAVDAGLGVYADRDAVHARFAAMARVLKFVVGATLAEQQNVVDSRS